MSSHQFKAKQFVSILVGLVFFVVTSVQAATVTDLQKQNQQLDQQAQQAQNAANQQKTIAQRAAEAVSRVASQISDLQNTIQDTANQINQTQAKIGDLDQQTAGLESQLRGIQDQQNKLVRMLYKLQVSNPDELQLFSSLPISEQVKRDKEFTEIEKSLAGMAKKTDDARLAVQSARDDQERERQRLSALRDGQQAQASGLADFKQQQADLQQNAVAAEQSLEAKAQADRIKSAAVDNQIEAALTAAIQARSRGTFSGSGPGVGKRVEQGDPIGAEGSTGHSTGAHLHEELRINNVPVDPQPYIPSKIHWGLKSFVITQGFGYNTGYGYLYSSGFHSGIDISAPIGSTVYAPASGTVILNASYGDYGHAFAIELDDGSVVLCGHLLY